MFLAVGCIIFYFVIQSNVAESEMSAVLCVPLDRSIGFCLAEKRSHRMRGGGSGRKARAQKTPKRIIYISFSNIPSLLLPLRANRLNVVSERTAAAKAYGFIHLFRISIYGRQNVTFYRYTVAKNGILEHPLNRFPFFRFLFSAVDSSELIPSKAHPLRMAEVHGVPVT